MYEVYLKRTVDKKMKKVDKIVPKCWINMIDPNEKEILKISKRFHIDPDAIRDALDEDELPRIESEHNYILIIIGIPHKERSSKGLYFKTYPLAIIFVDDVMITICKKENEVINDFINERVKADVYTSKRVRFLLQILNRTSNYFTIYLRYIEHEIRDIEMELSHDASNRLILRLLELQKSLLYFSKTTTMNHKVMQKIISGKVLPLYQEDMDLLDDVIVDNKQAMQMISLYHKIVSNLMDGYAFIISNNLNSIMKLLTSITIILAIPTMIASYYGMNVALPLAERSDAFVLILIASVIITILTTIWLYRRGYL